MGNLSSAKAYIPNLPLVTKLEKYVEKRIYETELYDEVANTDLLVTTRICIYYIYVNILIIFPRS